MSETNPDPFMINGFYLSTASESDNRARLLSTEPSEDVSYLLGQISLPTEQLDEIEDYLPNSDLEWVVHATFDKPLNAEEVASIFDKDWRSKYGGLMIYGLDTATGHWTFLISKDGPNRSADYSLHGRIMRLGPMSQK